MEWKFQTFIKKPSNDLILDFAPCHACDLPRKLALKLTTDLLRDLSQIARQIFQHYTNFSRQISRGNNKVSQNESRLSRNLK